MLLSSGLDYQLTLYTAWGADVQFSMDLPLICTIVYFLFRAALITVLLLTVLQGGTSARRRKPEGKVLIHSDQGVQHTCVDCRKFVSDNNLELSTSRRGNCHGNNDGVAISNSITFILKLSIGIIVTVSFDRTPNFNRIFWGSASKDYISLKWPFVL